MYNNLNPEIMKNSLLKWYMLAFLLVGNFVMFAQDGEGADPADDTQSETPPLEELEPTPINGRLIWLAIIGIAFAYSYYVKTQKDKNAA